VGELTASAFRVRVSWVELGCACGFFYNLLLTAALKTEGTGFSKTFVPLYQTVRCHISEHHNLKQVSKNIVTYVPLVSKNVCYCLVSNSTFGSWCWHSDILALSVMIQRKCCTVSEEVIASVKEVKN